MNILEKNILFSFFYENTKKKIDFYKKNHEDPVNRENLLKFFSKKKVDSFFNLISEEVKRIDYIIDEINSGNLRLISYFDDEYPESLRNIPDPPCMLYCRGDLQLLNHKCLISVVGARKTDDYGEEMTLKISSELAKAKMCIVSGLAIGIDSFSHLGALEIGGKTIAVIAADKVFPAKNRRVYSDIVENGLVVAEYPAGFFVKPSMFLARNRIIAALSSGTAVMRASIRSGSLSTARFAVDYNKDVFSLPGNVMESLSEGCNHLIRSGAVCITEAKDITDFYGIKTGYEMNIENLSEDEKKILKIIGYQPKNIDVITQEGKLSIKKNLEILTKLELMGYIKRKEGNKFIKL